MSKIRCSIAVACALAIVAGVMTLSTPRGARAYQVGGCHGCALKMTTATPPRDGVDNLTDIIHMYFQDYCVGDPSCGSCVAAISWELQLKETYPPKPATWATIGLGCASASMTCAPTGYLQLQVDLSTIAGGDWARQVGDYRLIAYVYPGTCDNHGGWIDSRTFSYAFSVANNSYNPPWP